MFENNRLRDIELSLSAAAERERTLESRLTALETENSKLKHDVFILKQSDSYYYKSIDTLQNHFQMFLLESGLEIVFVPPVPATEGYSKLQKAKKGKP